MKRFPALLMSIAVTVSATPFTAAAADVPAPADIDQAAYAQLFDDITYDMNEDGIFSEEELASSQWLNLDLTEVQDISWISRMENLGHINLRNGNITDLSVLSELPALKNVFLNSVPITDINFAKDMELDYLMLTNMEQITPEQRMEIIRCEDITVKKGFASAAGCFPIGLIEADEIKFRIDDLNVASFNSDVSGEDEKGFYRYKEIAAVYGKNCGETSYTIEFDGETLFSGKIKVEDTQYANIPPAADTEYSSELYTSYFYSSKEAILSNGRLYGFKDGKFSLYREDAKAFDYFYCRTGEEILCCDTVITSEGKAFVNDKPVIAPDGVKFRTLSGKYMISEDNGLYAVIFNDGNFTATHLADNCADFSENTFRTYYISTEGELIYIYSQYMSSQAKDGEDMFTCYPTGIMNPIGTTHDFFIDENNVLWEINTKKTPPVATKKAVDVVEVGFLTYDNGIVTGDVHIKSDGTAYKIGTSIKVTLYDRPTQGETYRTSGYFEIPRGEIMSNQLTPHDYYIDNENILTMKFGEKTAAVKDVAEFLFTTFENEILTCYFLRTDNTLWSYCFDTEEFICIEPAKAEISTKGDLNNDGTVNVADAVSMEKFLLGGDDPAISVNADFDNDGSVTVFDFIIMRKEIIKRGNLL